MLWTGAEWAIGGTEVWQQQPEKETGTESEGQTEKMQEKQGDCHSLCMYFPNIYPVPPVHSPGVLNRPWYSSDRRDCHPTHWTNGKEDETKWAGSERKNRQRWAGACDNGTRQDKGDGGCASPLGGTELHPSLLLPPYLRTYDLFLASSQILFRK